MTTPYIGFGNETLDKLPHVKEGDEIDCPICKAKHPLECGTVNGVKSDLIMFYKCGDRIYMGALSGKLTTGTKSDVSGEI